MIALMSYRTALGGTRVAATTDGVHAVDVTNLTDERFAAPGRAPSWPGRSPMRSLLEAGPDVFERATVALSAVVAGDEPWLGDVDDLELAPVIPDPGKILCVGLNFIDHVVEGGYARPPAIVGFSKLTSTLAADGDHIDYPSRSHAVDYELELAVVIGSRCRDISVHDAMDVIAGYTVAIDMTARDWVEAGVGGHVMMGKNFPGFAPIGPSLVPAREIEDVQDLGMQLRVNGELRQQGTTANMIFSVAEAVSFFSALTLEPGDVICTGTPGGVGAFKNPPVWLQPGDEIEGTIDHVGTLRVALTSETSEKR